MVLDVALLRALGDRHSNRILAPSQEGHDEREPRLNERSSLDHKGLVRVALERVVTQEHLPQAILDNESDDGTEEGRACLRPNAHRHLFAAADSARRPTASVEKHDLLDARSLL